LQSYKQLLVEHIYLYEGAEVLNNGVTKVHVNPSRSMRPIIYERDEDE